MAITAKEPTVDRVSIKLRAEDARIVEDQRLVYGWASVSEDKDGTEVCDYQDHCIEELELEAAVYRFMAYGAVASEMHRDWYAGSVVESIVFTKEKKKILGIPDGLLPTAWWVGIKVHDQKVFEKIKSGQYRMLSIAGTAIIEEVEDAADPD